MQSFERLFHVGIKPDRTYVEVGRGLAELGVEEVRVADDPLNQ